MKHLIPLLILTLFSSFSYGKEVAQFLSQHPLGLNLEDPQLSRRQWDRLRVLYVQTGNTGLLRLALLSQLRPQLEQVERALVFYDLFMARPVDFIKGAKIYDTNFGCILEILIPRSQFLPYSEIQRKLKELTEQNVDVEEFKRKAVSHFQNISSGKKLKVSEQCKF